MTQSQSMSPLTLINIYLIIKIIMKKLISLIASLFAAITILSASPSLAIHAYGGYSFGSDINGNYELDELLDNITAGAGIGLNIPMGKYFGIQPGIDICYSRIATTDDIKHTSTTIDIPVLLTATFKVINFSIGPYASFPILISTEYSIDSYGYSFSFHNFQLNIGLTAGLSFVIKIGSASLLFGGRYMLDLLPTKSIEEYKLFTRRAALFDIGFKFPLSW